MNADDAPIQFLSDSYMPVMVCPKCGFECTHVDTAVVVAASRRSVIVTAQGEDESATVNVEFAADRASMSSRRHDIRLVVHCEAGCISTVAFIQHKGTTYVEIV
jgi:hypothetical protein